MKNIITISMLSMLLFYSCKKTEIADFNGESGVYFYVTYENPRYNNSDPATWANQPYTVASFLNTNADTILLNLRVNISGNAVNYDRRFKVMVDQEHTTAIEDLNYRPLQTECLVKANEFFGNVPVVLKKASNLRDGEVQLRIKLEESSDFKLTMPVWYPIAGMQENVIANEAFDPRFHDIRFSNLLVAPGVWAWYGAATATGQETSYWGVFTPEKYELMCTLSNLTYSEFTSEKMGAERALTVANALSRYLREQFAKGAPVLESDGRLMWVYGVTWTSTVGVPYQP